MLYLVAWLTDSALILFVFSVTRLLADQSASPWTLGTLGAVFFLSSALSNVLGGRLSDRIGRKTVSFLGGLALVISLSVLLVFERDTWRLFISYAATGLSVGHIYPPVIAMLSEGVTQKVASFRFLMFGIAFNLGILSGQVGGGWLYDHLGHDAPLWTAIGMAGLTVVCLALYRRDRRRTSDADDGGGEVRSSEKQTVTDDERRSARQFVRLAWLANFAGMFSMSMLWFLFPALAVSLGLPAEQHGVVLGVGRATVIGIYIGMHLLTGWHHRFRYSMAAQLVGLVGMLLVCVAETPVGLAFGVLLLSTLLGYNYFASLFYNRAGHVDDDKGAAFGLNEAFLAFGASGGSLMGGWAATEWGARAPFQLAAMVIAAALLVQWPMLRRWRQEPGGDGETLNANQL